MGFGCVVQHGVGGYQEFQSASGAAAATIAASDAAAAVASVTNNGANLPALTFDSFLREMGRRGYPSAVVQSVLTLAWPFIPDRYRANLQRREQRNAPTPVTPPVSTPVQTSPHFPETSKGGINWTYVGIGAGALTLAATLAWKIFGRRRAA